MIATQDDLKRLRQAAKLAHPRDRKPLESLANRLETIERRGDPSHALGKLAFQISKAAFDAKADNRPDEVVEAMQYCASMARQAAKSPADISTPNVDWLANVIRTVDGDHTLGAGALAEKIIEAMEGSAS